MGLLDDIVSAVVDTLERFDNGIEAITNPSVDGVQAAEVFSQAFENLSPAEELAGLLVDLVEEVILADLQEAGQLTPDNVEQVQDQAEGAGTAVGLGVAVASTLIEAAGLGQLDGQAEFLVQALAGLGIKDVAGREIDARMQEGVDPALKQLVHRDHRSKQADFQDFTEGNLRAKSFDGQIETRSGNIPGGLQDLFHPNDLDWLPDPDTYGTIPDQTSLFELVGLDANEPEELIEEPIQYGIPVPKRPIEQVTAVRGLPEDAKDVYKAVIEALPKTENLMRDYARLTEFNFRLREKVQAGAITPRTATALIEPELRDLIENALPEDRLREEDRTADEVVDILAGELERNFMLLDSLPADPPSEGDLQAWFEKGVITSQEFQSLWEQFGGQPQFFNQYLTESAIDQGWEDIQRQFALDRIDAADAALRLRLIGYTQAQVNQILNGADGDQLVQQTFQQDAGPGSLPVTMADEIGDVRGARLRVVGINTLSELAQADVETVVQATGMTDATAETAIQSAQFLIQQQGQQG